MENKAKEIGRPNKGNTPAGNATGRHASQGMGWLDGVRKRLRRRFVKVDIESEMREMSQRSKNWLWENVKLFFILCAITVLAGIAFFAIFPDSVQKPSWSWQYDEEPLEKNAELKLMPGDELVYMISYNGTEHEVRIKALASPICKGVYLADMTSAEASFGAISEAAKQRPGEYAACLNRQGNEISHDGRILGSNVSFSNMSWPYFQPWMLALREGFVWKANITLLVMPTGTGMTSHMQWVVSEKRAHAGREAFVVKTSQIGSSSKFSPEVDMPEGKEQEAIIDSQYRVLLYSATDKYAIRLVRAPFAIGER